MKGKGNKMEYEFEKCISGIMNTAIRVEIEESVVDKIAALVTDLIEQKAKEQHHIVDNRKTAKRFTTGFLGEAALEKIFGMPIIDWTIGNSNEYHIPDVPGYKVGIKAVEYGKFPIVFKKNYYPQIICIVDTFSDRTVYVCGIAMPDVLNKYQDDDLILDRQLRDRGTKSGFYGFEYLRPIRGIEDIEAFRKKESIRRAVQYAKREIIADKKCPKCGKDLVLRNGRYGQFWGCTGFPECKYSENSNGLDS